MSATKKKTVTKKIVPYISLVVPFHNEEDNIDEFFKRVTPILDKVNKNWEIICIDDGSSDKTLELLAGYHKKQKKIKVISLSRNFGKESALTAGLDFCNGDVVVPIDADLQDPPELILDMVAEWKKGYKVVLAVRNSRAGESLFKKFTASAFYKIIGAITTTEISENTGDFRLLDRDVVAVIKQLKEKNRFMKGILSWPGFEKTIIYFDRDKRHAGDTSWNYAKLWSFALDGIFSFSTLPLKVWTYVGVLVSLGAFLYAMFLIFRTMVLGVDVPGYASIMVVMLFLGGVQLISLGVIGEYVGRIYNEAKARPIYVIGQSWGIDG